MPPQEITGILSSVRPKRRYFIAPKISHAAGDGKRPPDAIDLTPQT
jgi:hypothetical protein